MARVSQANQNQAEAFCNLCEWIYECWATHKNLLENLPELLKVQRGVSIKEFSESPYGHCLNYLNEISIQYTLLKIATLHDPAQQGRNNNLSINFFVEQEEIWSDIEKLNIGDIVSKLDSLYQKIKPLRDKILVHNDQSIFENNQTLGEFTKGEDEMYFLKLGELCSMIWNKFPHPGWHYGSRIFEFTITGIIENSPCPCNNARKLCQLLVESYPEPNENNL